MIYNRPVPADPATNLALAQSAPDYLTSQPTSVLQAVFRAAETAPLEALLNRGAMRVDVARQRLWRDVFWKGTFARDHWLGWDERWLTPAPPDGSHYSGGRFWKRFDTLTDGAARGHVVNFNLGVLPGKPEVREVRYPDGNRRYVAAGDRVLLLQYLNPPYRAVYDLVKIVGPDTCVGVMHLGKFPRGLAFASFVLSRNNYPFVHMTVPDHDALFQGEPSRVPTLDEAAGRWRGRIAFSTTPDQTMHNQFNPRLVSLHLTPGPDSRGSIRIGLVSRSVMATAAPDHLRLTAVGGHHFELRIISPETLLGRRVSSGGPGRRFVLTRA